ncbi:twin-arginine translocation pathway signal [Saccharobesus litoralis]|uniref:Twin-arginine translocation pathway signal n=1 Tax=Saccharobesus litoralis TaxID=2172099 RepID=A0A2S0VNC9_9ALTE|nr:alkaline phosphatase D family protein [Saccharobesus litoralis]AWB65679.1 twin-arginine translocation pathway signal [Saccharobesus litoralis]
MSNNISRRSALKLAVAGLATSAIGCSSTTSSNTQPVANQVLDKPVTDAWGNTFDRMWIGGEYWANPMENWRIIDGGAECTVTGGNRSIHSLTHQLVNPDAAFSISVNIKKAEIGKNDGGAAIRVGVQSDINDHRSNVFVQTGLDAGIVNGQLVLGKLRAKLSHAINHQQINLTLTGEPRLGVIAVKVVATDTATGKQLGMLEDFIAEDKVMGNVAVVSNFTSSASKAHIPNGTRYRFTDWQMAGAAFNNKPEQKFGPILWTMYTLSDTRTSEGFVMKLSALTGPMGKQDSQEVELQIKKDGIWQSLGTERLDTDAWVATFRIANWQEASDTPYRVVYKEKQRDGSIKPDIYEGKVRANPVGRQMRMAGLTCQNDYAFPYAPVAENVVKMDPDLVYFSGDQLYENHGGYGVKYGPAKDSINNYLRKYYQFGWAFREAMRNAPTVVLPDDHDILQGNLWGEGGIKMADESIASGRTDNAGGYIAPIRVVNAVHKTHTAHHPDPIDPTPSARGMSVYYTDMVYGDVSFAIIGDRQWKSGPEHLGIEVGITGEGEDPHFINPAFDRQDMELLGKRQEDFLEKWGKDWRGHKLKAVLSQTVFAAICTHQPRPNKFLKYDFDSSGWPAGARNRAIEIMRESKALHICGDTHLGSLTQYGVKQQRDSNWAFCTPAIAAGWPRWWNPDTLNFPVNNRPSHGIAHTGEYLDAFGNNMYVYAVGNPIVGKSGNRYIKAHEKGSGFGFILFDTEAKTYTTQAYRFLVDVTDGKASNQFPGWPVTIHQEENIGKNRIS